MARTPVAVFQCSCSEISQAPGGKLLPSDHPELQPDEREKQAEVGIYSKQETNV